MSPSLSDRLGPRDGELPARAYLTQVCTMLDHLIHDSAKFESYFDKGGRQPFLFNSGMLWRSGDMIQGTPR